MSKQDFSIKSYVNHSKLLELNAIETGKFYFPVKYCGEPDDICGRVILYFDNGFSCLGESKNDVLKIFLMDGDPVTEESKVIAWMPMPKYDESVNYAVQLEAGE